MDSSGLRNATYPGFDRALVDRSWTFLCSCGETRVYDSENVRARFLEDFPQIDWGDQIIPLLCTGITSALDGYGEKGDGIALPILIRSEEVGVKIPVDLRHAVDAEELIAAVMPILPLEQLPETIRFGDPSYLRSQEGKCYGEAIEALRRISEQKRRFFTCNEIDHHLFTHVFDNGGYHRSFVTVNL